MAKKQITATVDERIVDDIRTECEAKGVSFSQVIECIFHNKRSTRSFVAKTVDTVKSRKAVEEIKLIKQLQALGYDVTKAGTDTPLREEKENPTPTTTTTEQPQGEKYARFRLADGTIINNAQVAKRPYPELDMVAGDYAYRDSTGKYIKIPSDAEKLN